jgi:Flp pilus assembly protein TadG
MKKLRVVFKNRKGNMSLFAGIIVLLLCIVFAGIFEYVRVYTIANTVNTTIQRDLESTVIQAAKDSFQSVKQYSLSSPIVSRTTLENCICSDLGLIKQGNTFNCVSDKVAKFIIENPELTYSSDTILTLTYTFTLQIPVYYFGVQIETVNIPMTVNATYQFK